MRLDQDALERWGERIGATITTPAFIGLAGPLGAGKSVLARAIGSGAGVQGPMPSPTFTLQQHYAATRGRRVVHMDLYRVGTPEDLWELGWSQIPEDDSLVLVEWPENAGALLPEDHWIIELTPSPGEPLLRDVEVRRVGSPPDLAAFPLTLTER